MFWVVVLYGVFGCVVFCNVVFVMRVFLVALPGVVCWGHVLWCVVLVWRCGSGALELLVTGAGLLT